MEILIGVVLAVLATWLAEDLKPWLRRIKLILVRAAVALAPPSDREVCEEAWMADAEDIDGNIRQLFWASNLIFASAKLRVDRWKEIIQNEDMDTSNDFVVIDGIPFADIQATARRCGGRGYITLDELDELEVGDIIKASTAINTDNFLKDITGIDIDEDFMNESFWLIVKQVDGDNVYATVDNTLLFTDYHGMDYEDVVKVEKRCIIRFIKKDK